ncbi:MAG: DMT family transporter [Clostridiales bacterium]|nr:DMT family transporter [Clostridiales bacterium]
MKRIIGYIIISTTLFSSMEVVLKAVGNELDAFQITFIRFLIGGLFLLPFAIKEIKRRETKFTIADYRHMILMGIVCICLSMSFFQLGVDNSNASTAAVIFCLNPLFTMVFAHFMTEEKLNRRKMIALGFGIIGIVFMINPWDVNPGDSLLGASFSLIAALVFGLYSAMGRTSIHRLGGITQTSLSFVFGSIVMLIVLLVADKPVISGINMDNIAMVLYVGVMVTGLGYLFYFLIMQLSDASTASIVFFIKPIFAPIMAVILLNEAIRLNGIIGIALIFISSYINLREHKKKLN